MSGRGSLIGRPLEIRSRPTARTASATSPSTSVRSLKPIVYRLEVNVRMPNDGPSQTIVAATTTVTAATGLASRITTRTATSGAISPTVPST